MKDHINKNIKTIICLFLVLVMMLALSGCSLFFEELQKVSQTHELLGTEITITVIDKDVDNAKNAIMFAFEEIQRIENIMNVYNNNSEVGKLNLNSRIKNPSSELVFLINRSIYYSRISDGAFDITVQPLLDLYTKTFGEYGRPPDDYEISKTLEYVGYDKIKINDKTILIEPKMKITLGGIAKGYAIDRAIDLLKSQGISRALVNVGGDVAAIGLNSDYIPWKIALQNPREDGDYITIINIENKSVATSGDYERYFDENMISHHIMDPKTGRSATDLISVTIVADNAIDTDALATAVFVLGRDNGINLIEGIANTEALIITKEREIIRSSGFEW